MDATRRPPTGTFVGRHRELAALSALLDGCWHGHSAAFIQGEAGIGKTALVTELLRRARERGTATLRGSCYPGREAGAYFPLHQLFSQLHPRGSFDSCVEKALADGPSEGAAPGLPTEARVRRGQAARRLAGELARLIGLQPTVLCVEDLQWADSGTLLVLNALLDSQVPHLAVVCTARPDESDQSEARQFLAQIEAKSQRIALRGLKLGEARDFLASPDVPWVLATAEVRALQAVTGGNPLFLRELHLHLQESRLLESHSVLEAIHILGVPRPLAHVLDWRLHSLTARARKTLGACAITGMEFATAVAARAAALAPSAVKRDLQQGVNRALLWPSASGFRFAHALFAMRLQEVLSPAETRATHRRLADAALSGALPLSQEEVARHLALGYGAKAGKQGVERCQAAAERAERGLALEEAGRFWELALVCTSARSRRTRAEIYARLGRTRWAAGAWAPAGEAWTRAVALFTSLGDEEAAGRLALDLGHLHRWRHDLPEAERWLQEVIRAQVGGTSARALALALLASVRCVNGEREAALALLDEAQRLAKPSSPDPVLAYWLSYGYAVSGRAGPAYALAKEGLEEARRRGAGEAVSLLARNLFAHDLSYLDLCSAREHARLVEDALDPADPSGLIRLFMCQALLLGYEGRWKAVQRLCRRWSAAARTAGPFQAATARFVGAEARLALGAAEEARTEMLASLRDLGEMRRAAALHLALVSIRVGREEEATAIVRQLAERVLAAPVSMAGHAVLGEVLSHLEAPKLQRRCYEVLRRESRPVVMVYRPISVQRVLGRLAARLGLWEEAVGHFEATLRQLIEGGARSEAAQAYADYAEMRRLRGRRGDQRKAIALELQASAIWQQLRLPPSVPLHTSTEPDGNRFALTARELEVLALVAQGSRNHQIASALTLTTGTVNRHLQNIFAKMGVGNRAEAVAKAVQDGLVVAV